MSVIARLPQHLVNRIAAGEVVERPASVVKELLENCLDAGASTVTVEVEDGGKKLIRVTDDGKGMEPSDLTLAVAPHATSKIRNDDDLFAINTMGFRGEALASIASISQMEIISREADAIEGAKLVCYGGQEQPVEPTAAPVGTTILVRNLFFNTPARRKFLRTSNTEMGHISEYFTRVALAHSEVGFTLIHNGRTLQQLPAGQGLQERIGMLFSGDMAQSLMSVQRIDTDAKVWGLIAPPQSARSGTQWQYVFLNGRYIRDKFVGHAIKEAYRGMLEINRSPVVFLFIEVAPDSVDVNVHPAKIEVRFSNSNRIHSLVLATLRDRLLSTDLTVGFKEEDLQVDGGGRDGERGGRGAEGDSSIGDQAAGQQRPGEDQGKRKERIREAMAAFFSRAEPGMRGDGGDVGAKGSGAGYSHAAKVGMSRGGDARGDGADAMTAEDGLSDRYGEVRGAGEHAAGGGESGARGAFRLESEQRGEGTLGFTDMMTTGGGAVSAGEQGGAALGGDNAAEDGGRNDGWGDDGALGKVMQVHRSYLLVETEQGVEIIDQHALHERILYEQFKRHLLDGDLASQHCLIPETIDVTARHVAVAEESEELLKHLGIIVEPFGPTTLAIQGYPVLMERGNPVQFVSDLLELLLHESSRLTREELMHHVLDMMACKAAVKAGDPLDDDEIRQLLKQRKGVARIGQCPHGRPTTITLTVEQLAKQFKRT